MEGGGGSWNLICNPLTAELYSSIHALLLIEAWIYIGSTKEEHSTHNQTCHPPP